MKRLLTIVVIATFCLMPVIAQQIQSTGLSEIANHYAVQDYRKALDLVETYKARSVAERTAVSYLKGYCYLKLGMFGLAIETFSEVLDELSENYEVLNNIGVAYYEQADYKNALKYFNLSFLANTSFTVAQGNYNTALERLQSSTSGVVLKPMDDKNTVLNSSGWFYYYLGNLEKAKYYFSQAITDKPEFSENYVALSYVLDSAHQFELSLKYLLQANEIDKDNPNIENNLGVLFYHLGKSDIAKQHFETAIHLNPTFAEPKNNKAFLLIDEGNFRPASVLFKAAISDNSYSTELLAESLAGLAICQYILGESVLSRANKERAISADYKLKDKNYLVNFLQWKPKTVEIWERF